MGESATEIFTPHMKQSAPNTPCSCGQIFTEICLYFDLAVITLCSALCSSVDLVSICSRRDVAALWSTWKPLIQSMSITLMQHLSYLLIYGVFFIIFASLFLSPSWKIYVKKWLGWLQRSGSCQALVFDLSPSLCLGAAGENHSIMLIIIILRWLMHILSSFFLGITSEFRLCLLCGCSLRLFRICYKTKRCCYTAQTTEHGTGSVHLSKRGRRFQVEGCKMSVSQSSPILESRPVAVRMPRWRTHLLLLYFKIHTLASY